MNIQTPVFIVDEALIRKNCEILAGIRQRTGCTILLALKGYAMWSMFPLIREYLDGVCASSPWEARLGREEFRKQVHAYAAAYSDADFATLLTLCDTIDFNSFSQLNRFRAAGLLPPREQGRREPVQFGLRINPECSTQKAEHSIYDPCAPRSRLGIRRAEFEARNLDGISGLHSHTLCEQNAADLATTLAAVEEQFLDILPRIEWVNFGGGHHITRADYDLDLLCKLINDFKKKYDVQVILEPGEAVALNAGTLMSTVLDIIDNDGPIAILDISCTCHMPDVLEMPYRPDVEGAGLPNEKSYTYKLAGLSCLAGDVIGDYSFDHPLKIGDRLVFQDMAHYSMVKTTFFNGIQHPAIAMLKQGEMELVRQFDYPDYKGRLG